ncbi:hypothetical protein AKJ48_00275 [candidate division MSBL1 archaeon SCGC-AAA261O19]|uniref:Glycosyltransferase 2-like domain-containing protein n=1 Tax=candidate division MSBL1 archaeon SCGC-AAA261O19 TaxID=1698277 RepID=A0A133VFB4_9EURY|nr:hypothetical protein AKJ48_00275 [candidate division MSBL1 archaeon SCGC-AAA261O19]
MQLSAYNEENRIKPVIEETKKHVDRVIVIDDGSFDRTAEVSRKAGADVLVHKDNKGYLKALKTGFNKAQEGIVITIDADGENDPKFIPELVQPILKEKTDLVLGKREHVPRVSERFISFITSPVVDVSDTGTGFRALKADLAKKLDLEGLCPCGTFVLEAKKLGARIEEVPVKARRVDKPKKIAWKHLPQLWYVAKALIRL